MPQLALVLASGNRHLYKVDHRLLSQKRTNLAGNYEASYQLSPTVSDLKHLLWQDWQSEPHLRPSSPSAMRLVHFGRLLDDTLPIQECRFLMTAPNVVHVA